MVCSKIDFSNARTKAFDPDSYASCYMRCVNSLTISNGDEYIFIHCSLIFVHLFDDGLSNLCQPFGLSLESIECCLVTDSTISLSFNRFISSSWNGISLLHTKQLSFILSYASSLLPRYSGFCDHVGHIVIDPFTH